MNSSKTTLVLIFCLVILFSCALTKNYKKPIIEPIEYLFSYETTKSTSEEKINSPILITSNDFVTDINLDWQTNSYDFELNKSFERDLKNIENINEINSNFFSSQERDLIKILKNSGTANTISKNSTLHNLTYEDRKNSSANA